MARVRVKASLPEGLPPARIDADSLKQVVLALAVTAASAMPGGGTLSVRAASRGRSLLLDVSDTAPALVETERKRLFEPFATGLAQRGGGLGLAIARSLLRSRGGDLFYRPRKGGNAFRVSLRVATGSP
jgi:signal transduction histidine kinase